MKRLAVAAIAALLVTSAHAETLTAICTMAEGGFIVAGIDNETDMAGIGLSKTDFREGTYSISGLGTMITVPGDGVLGIATNLEARWYGYDKHQVNLTCTQFKRAKVK